MSLEVLERFADGTLQVHPLPLETEHVLFVKATG